MKILFVDDMDARRESFDKQLDLLTRWDIPYEVWYAWNGEDAQKLISEKTLDVMFLDHDLSDDQYVEHSDGILRESKNISGTELARQVVALPVERQPKLVIVHSWNKYGAERMMKDLRDSAVKQFVQCMFSDNLLNTVFNYVVTVVRTGG